MAGAVGFPRAGNIPLGYNVFLVLGRKDVGGEPGFGDPDDISRVVAPDIKY